MNTTFFSGGSCICTRNGHPVTKLSLATFPVTGHPARLLTPSFPNHWGTLSPSPFVSPKLSTRSPSPLGSYLSPTLPARSVAPTSNNPINYFTLETGAPEFDNIQPVLLSFSHPTVFLMPSMDCSSPIHCNGHMTHGTDAYHMGTPILISPSAGHSEIPYVIYVSTASLKGSATSHDVHVRLIGDICSTSFIPLRSAQPSDPLSSSLSTSLPHSPISMTTTESPNAAASTDSSFPAGSVREFLIHAPDVGNLLQIALRHASSNQLDAAWKPDRILVRNDHLHRSWSFLCPRWLNNDVGNDIELTPTGDVAAGRRASRQASRRISADKIPCAPSPVPQARKRFETMRERFSGEGPNATPEVLRGNDDGTRKVQFQLQKYAQTASHLYLVGSIPALGKWEPKQAVRMEKHSGLDGHWRGEWRLNLVLDDDFDEIQYRYMVVSEGASPGCRVAYFTNPQRVLRLTDTTNRERHAEGESIYVKDSFRAERTSQSPRRMRSLPFINTQAISIPHGSAGLSVDGSDPSTLGQSPFHRPHNFNTIPRGSPMDRTVSQTSVSNWRDRHISSRNVAEESSAVVEYSDSDMDIDERTHRDSSSTTNGFHENQGVSSPNEKQRRSSEQMLPGNISLHGMDAAQSFSPSEDRSPTSSGSTERVHADDMVVFGLREKIKNLEDVSNDLRVERDSVIAKHDVLNASFESTLKERDEARAESASIRLEADSSQKEIEDLKLQLQMSREEQTKILKERDATREESEAVRLEFSSVSHEVGELRQQLWEARERLQVCERENESLKEQSARESEGSLTSAREELCSTQKLVVELEEDLNTKKDLLAKSTEAVLTLNDTVESLHKELLTKTDELSRTDKVCSDLRQQLSEKDVEFKTEISHLNCELEDVTNRWAREFKERRKLFNTVQELRGNIRVFCRVRPSKDGHPVNNPKFISFPDAHLGEHGRIQTCGKSFEFDHVFQPASSQQEIYDETAGVVVSVVDGYNVCVFAYGQTGSGKTYTMNGTDFDRGVNYRALQNLFEIADQRREHCDVSVSVSMLEIYNETLRDLISPGGENGPKLEIRRDPTGSSPNAVHVPNLAEVEVNTFDETWDVMMKGTMNRSIGRTDMNEHSSRSHLLVRVTVRCEDFNSGVKTAGVLHLVDLAGSERVSRSNASGDRLKEAQHINKSLSSLGDVFSALVSHANHVPYRNSRLTYLLQDSLGGDSKTLMFVNVSCDENDGQETLSSLLFAQRVAKVELGNAKKHTERTGEAKAKVALSEKETQNRELVGKIAGLQKELKKRDECIAEMRQRSRSLEGEVSSIRDKLDDALRHEECTRDELVQALDEEKSARDGLTNELEVTIQRAKEVEARKDEEIGRLTMRLRDSEKEVAALCKENDSHAEVDREIVQLRMAHETTEESLKAKDEEIRHLQTVIRAREREIAELVKQGSKSSEENETEVSSEGEGRLERQVSEPFIDNRTVERAGPTLPVRRATSSASGRSRQVRFDESEAQANLNNRKANHEVVYKRSQSLSIPAVGNNSAIVGPPRRAKDSGVPRAQSSGTIPRATGSKTTAVRASTAPGHGSGRRPTYAFGSRVSNFSDKHGGGALRSGPGRVPRSLTGSSLPKRASMPVVSANPSGSGRSQTGVPSGLPQRARGSVPRTSTVATMNRNSAPSGNRLVGEHGNDRK